MSFLHTGALVPAPLTQRSPLGASERTSQQAGSGSMLCAPLCELWRPLDDLGHSPSPQTLAEPPPLCPPWRTRCRGRTSLQRENSRSRPVSSAPTAPGLVPHVGVLTGMEAGPFHPVGSWIGDPARSRSLHNGSVCDTEPQISLGKCSCLPTFPCGWAQGGKLVVCSFSTGHFHACWVTHPVCWRLPPWPLE